MAPTVSISQKKTLDRAGAAGDVGQRHLPKEACLRQNNPFGYDIEPNYIIIKKKKKVHLTLNSLMYRPL